MDLYDLQKVELQTLSDVLWRQNQEENMANKKEIQNKQEEGSKSVWPTCLGFGAVALAICWQQNLSIGKTIGIVCCVAYLPSFFEDSEHTGERYWPAYAAFARKFISPFSAYITYEQEIDPTKQYIYCSHPHGLLSAHHGTLLSGGSKPSFHDIKHTGGRRHLAASACMWIPLYREYLLWLGCVNARRKVAENMLSIGRSLFIVVGGITEQMLSQRGRHDIYVKRRKGHIKLALKHGVSIVPIYSFGETDLYTHSPFLLHFRRKVSKKLSAAFILLHGPSKLHPLRPYPDVELNQVFGTPIPVKKTPNPTEEDIEKLHAKYVSELQRIFEKYKVQFGYEKCELIIH